MTRAQQRSLQFLTEMFDQSQIASATCLAPGISWFNFSVRSHNLNVLLTYYICCSNSLDIVVEAVFLGFESLTGTIPSLTLAEELKEL